MMRNDPKLTSVELLASNYLYAIKTKKPIEEQVERHHELLDSINSFNSTSSFSLIVYEDGKIIEAGHIV